MSKQFFEKLDSLQEKEMQVTSGNTGQVMKFNLNKIDSYTVTEDDSTFIITHTLDYNNGTEITDKYLIARKPFQVDATTQHVIVFGYNHLVYNTFTQCEHDSVKEFLFQALMEIVDNNPLDSVPYKYDLDSLEYERVEIEGVLYEFSNTLDNLGTAVEAMSPHTKELETYDGFLSVNVTDTSGHTKIYELVEVDGDIAVVNVETKEFEPVETTLELMNAIQCVLLKMNDLL